MSLVTGHPDSRRERGGVPSLAPGSLNLVHRILGSALRRANEAIRQVFDRRGIRAPWLGAHEGDIGAPLLLRADCNRVDGMYHENSMKMACF